MDYTSNTNDMAEFLARREREQRRFHARRPKKLADVLAMLITKRGYGRLQAGADMQSAWQSAVGEALGRFTRVGQLRRGQLEITVANSAVLQELTFQKQQILAQLQRELADSKIRALRFRVGAIN